MHLTFHASQVVVPACVYTNVYFTVHLLQRWKYFRVEGTLRYFPLPVNPEPSLVIQTVFIEKETTDWSLVYSEPNNQEAFCQVCLKGLRQ